MPSSIKPTKKPPVNTQKGNARQSNVQQGSTQKTSQTTKVIGDYYERLACEFLQANGLEIVTMNYRVDKVGEIDIIAHQHKILPNGRAYAVLVFVEVRKRKHSQFASSLETITKAKQRRLIATASHFLQSVESAQSEFFGRGYQHADCRFDVLAFDVDSQDKVYQNWVQGAFLVQ